MVIYLVRNKVNNKIYIGKTIKTLDERKNRHIWSAKHYNIKKHRQSLFYKAINKYGIKNFIWKEICRCSTLDELNKKEVYYIKLYDSLNRQKGYNIHEGGTGGDCISQNPNNKQIRMNISNAKRGTKMTEQFRLNNRLRQIGKKFSELTLQKRSDTLKGRKLSHLWKLRLSLKFRRKYDKECFDRKIRVAIFGGAFNPVTVAHAEIINQLITTNIVDQVWICPCVNHTFNKEMCSIENRIKMLQLALNHRKNRNTIQILIDYCNNSYEWIKVLINETKDMYDFYFVIGLDNALIFHKWQNYELLQKLINFIVIPRQDYTFENENEWFLTSPNIYLKDLKFNKCSSTIVRSYLKRTNINFSDIKNFLNKKVFDYIIANKLYK